jgi:NitT/TauT family transport system ATP-binding protein
MIELRAVSKTFSTRSGNVEALRDVSLSFQEGEFICLVGPSGSGKTTILNIIAGLERPEAGQVQAFGRPIEGPSPERTVMFQDAALFPWLTVEQNVAFPLIAAGQSVEQRNGSVMRFLRLVHLSKFARSYVHELSGGMRQRVALARSLAANARVWLMDEPFSALDAQTRDVLHAELESLWLQEKKTVVFVTHNVHEAVRLADRVVVLATRPGRVKREFAIDIPRPRAAEDRDVGLVAAQIMLELKAEIEKVMREELDEEWKPPESRAKRPKEDKGGGI